MDRGRNRPGKLLASILALASLAGCDIHLLGPDEGQLDVERLRLSTSSTREVLEVGGGATRASIEPEAEARVRITTSDGDRETVAVRRNLCGTGDAAHVCDEFNFGMKDGLELDEEVRSRIRRELDARLLRVFAFEAATVKIFSGDLDAALHEVRGWPGVEYAEPNGFMYLHEGNGDTADTVHVSVSGALPVGEAPPTPEDGVLQVSPGDTVVATHRAADGEEITACVEGWPGGGDGF